MEQDHQAGGHQAELTAAGVWVCNVCGVGKIDFTRMY